MKYKRSILSIMCKSIINIYFKNNINLTEKIHKLYLPFLFLDVLKYWVSVDGAQELLTAAFRKPNPGYHKVLNINSGPSFNMPSMCSALSLQVFILIFLIRYQQNIIFKRKWYEIKKIIFKIYIIIFLF